MSDGEKNYVSRVNLLGKPMELHDGRVDELSGLISRLDDPKCSVASVQETLIAVMRILSGNFEQTNS